MNEQAENQRRVAKNIESTIVAFARQIYKVRPPLFHMEELTTYVRERVGIAPDSAGRILRQLRQQGKVDYVVVNRRESLYQLTHVL